MLIITCGYKNSFSVFILVETVQEILPRCGSLGFLFWLSGHTEPSVSF